MTDEELGKSMESLRRSQRKNVLKAIFALPVQWSYGDRDQKCQVVDISPSFDVGKIKGGAMALRPYFVGGLVVRRRRFPLVCWRAGWRAWRCRRPP